MNKEPRVLYIDNSSPRPTHNHSPGENYVRERQIELLIRRLPCRLQGTVRWLRRPSARWVRIPIGLLLILGGVFFILPFLGLWMLPLGLVLLAEDLRLLRRGTDRILSWIERHRPHWMGLPSASNPQTTLSGENSP